jgi:hypothetical protein
VKNIIEFLQVKFEVFVGHSDRNIQEAEFGLMSIYREIQSMRADVYLRYKRREKCVN